MAESKGALIAKTVQKHAGRAKEKVSVSHLPRNLTTRKSQTSLLAIDESSSLNSISP